MVVGHRPYGRHRGARPGRPQGVRLVRLREPGLADPRPDPGHPACSRASASTCRCRRPTPASGVDRSAFDLAKFIAHIFPKSMIDAMASNEILQIVVFSLFLGVAITAVGEPARPLVRALEALVEVMLQVTDYVMRFAPFAVFAAVAATHRRARPGDPRQPTAISSAASISGWSLLWAAADRHLLPRHRQPDARCSSATSATRSCSLSRPPRRKPPSRARWRRSTGSACRRGSPASCCRSAIRSTSTAR